jgi:hypothetical protein
MVAKNRFLKIAISVLIFGIAGPILPSPSKLLFTATIQCKSSEIVCSGTEADEVIIGDRG